MQNIEVPVGQKDALYRAGRNMLNFQRLEHALKALLPFLSFSVKKSQDQIISSHAIESRQLRKNTLGNLTHSLDKKLFEPRSQSALEIENASLFSFSMKLDLLEPYRSEYRKKWKELLKNRNNLIHHQLVKFDLSSAEDCAFLCDELDTQNQMICAQFEEINNLFETIKYAHTQLEAKLELDTQQSDSSGGT